MPNNNSTNKAQTVKINNYRYAAIKLPKNKFIKILFSFRIKRTYNPKYPKK